MNWVAGHEPVLPEHLAPLVERHVDWIAQTPFGWQRHVDSPEVRLVTGGRVMWGESDLGIEVTTRQARALGIRTLLKPQIWLTRPESGQWLEHVSMTSDAAWDRWFESYRQFILHYAELAQRLEIEALCVGAELRGTVAARPDAWRRIIADVRAVYHGQVTYAANWYREFEEVPFWDALDFIGIQAYFPLTDQDEPSVAELERGWAPHVAALERLARRVGKPVLFTEIGYRSMTDAAIRPWEWREPHPEQASAAELETQARCYEAFFASFWHRDWFAGAFIWKWFAGARIVPGREFSPQGKPAEEVLSRWYGS